MNGVEYHTAINLVKADYGNNTIGGFKRLPSSTKYIGVYIEEAKFEKRPLSKMKRDILIELGIITDETK